MLRRSVLLLAALLVTTETPAAGQDAAEALEAAEAVQLNLNYVWTVAAAALVFFMQAGFGLLETGFTRAKNAINIIMKNVTDASVGVLMFFAVGFGVMFGTSWNGLFGTDGFFLLGIEGQDLDWMYAFFLFQAVFAATAATIVSGAVAERTRFSGYLVFSLIITGLIYPVFGSWAWGGAFNGAGWLEQMGFIDFAGSTVVHSIGGWAALAGALVVGPRVGKYAEDGSPNTISGHSLPLAALGVFILWLGWFGFNAGSTNAGTPEVARIATNTLLAGGSGAIAAMTTTWMHTGHSNAPMTLNGVLAGLVSITAGCATLFPGAAILTGLTAGVIVVHATNALEWVVDDPVGAIAVHGVCGAWGTLAAGLFDPAGFDIAQVTVQVIGIGAAFSWAFPVSYLLFKLADVFMDIRLEASVQRKGLDHHEHDDHAYPEFDFEEIKEEYESALEEAASNPSKKEDTEPGGSTLW